MAENFPVVVVLRPLLNGPLKFLSAQADADALYSPDSAAAGAKTKVGKRNRTSPPLEEEPAAVAAAAAESIPHADTKLLNLAAELHLPGMQVVVSEAAGLVPFTVSDDWNEAVHAVVAEPLSTGPVVVCGAKGVGKSTMCRLLVNRLLNRHPMVAYMDCDLGQPEFTAPGQVSLHLLDSPVVAPPHANIRRARLAYFVGTMTSKPEPLLYSAAVRALAEHALAWQGQSASFAGDAPPPPLVVNTDGWVKGMGLDLLGAVIDAVRPRHVLQILGVSLAKTFELDRLPMGCKLHPVGAWSPPRRPLGGPPAPPRPSAQDLRTLRLVAYFVGRGCGGGDSNGENDEDRPSSSSIGGSGASTGAALAGELAKRSSDSGGGRGGGRLMGAGVRGGSVYDQEHEVAALLAARTPRRVPWRAIQIRVMNGPVPPSLVMHAVNGALVGLVAMPLQPWEAGGGDVREGQATGQAPVCLAETPVAPCVGLGIVRSVDVEKRVLYVLTPEPIDVLKGVTVLVKGSLQPPMEMMYDPNWCSNPYFSSEAVGGEVIKNRMLLRRGPTA